MPAYLIVQQTVVDADKLEEYRDKVGPVLEKYGARFLTRSSGHRRLSGTGELPDRVAIVEFPDIATLHAWYGSSEYQPLIGLRHAAVDPASESLIAVDGA